MWTHIYMTSFYRWPLVRFWFNFCVFLCVSTCLCVRISFFCVFVFQVFLGCMTLIVSTSAVDCLQRVVSDSDLLCVK